MQRIFPLPSFAYSGAAGSIIVPLDQLPPGYRLRGILATLQLNVTQSAVAAAVTAATLNRLFAMLTIGKRFRATGAGLNALFWAMMGRDFSLCADIPATNATAFSRDVKLWLPYSDLDAYEPDDTAPNVALFKDSPLQVDLASLTALAATLTGALAATLRTNAVIEKSGADFVATPQRINFADYAGQQVRLDPGSYSHIVAYKEDGSNFTAAEVSALSVAVDGEPVAQRNQMAELAAIFNIQKAKGSNVQSLSATAPVAGESLGDEPAVAGAAADTVDIGPFLPIFVPRAGYRMTRVLHARRGITIDFEGTLQAFRIGYRRLEPQSADQVVRAARKQGVVATKAKSAVAGPNVPAPGSYAAALLPKVVGP